MSSDLFRAGWGSLLVSVAMGAIIAGASLAEDPKSSTPAPGAKDDLTKLNLEDLMNQDVTSVSKQKQRVADAPAAVTVITPEDMQRSHLDSVAELLRLVPGMDVARLNANTWAISARGFNSNFSDKLLVLVDGRTVYTPLFSGVFWDQQQMMIGDLERIEVIRGPGATLWGSNAVNGVVNVTSKSARDTQGFLVDTWADNFTQRGAVRYGGKISDDTFYRVWTQYQTTDNFKLPVDDLSGGDGHDGWDSLHGGFRLDKYSGSDDVFTIIANAGQSREGSSFSVPVLGPPFAMQRFPTDTNSEYNVLGRWTHVISDSSDFTAQFYYDRLNQHVLEQAYTLDVADVDFEHRFGLGDRQVVIWGAGYRFTADDAPPSPLAVTTPQRRDDYIASAFIQDDVTVVKDRFHVIVGTKLEENSYSGFEVQPTARFIWTPSETQTFWGAVSRAVRTPNRFQENSRVNLAAFPVPGSGLPGVAQIEPNFHVSSQEEMSYELGHRIQATKTLSFDTSIYYNRYNHLSSFEPGTPFFAASPMPHLIVPQTNSEKIDADAYGAEVAANWRVTDKWRLAASYTFSIIDAHPVGSSSDRSSVLSDEGQIPRNQAQLHSYLDLTRDLHLDTSLYFVDALKNPSVPAYVRGDVALSWDVNPHAQFTIGAQNLFQRKHTEFDGDSVILQDTKIPRTFFVQFVYKS